MEIQKSNIGDLIIEGKTKRVHRLKSDPSLVYVQSKDRITAGDGVKSHEMVGKARISTQTNCAIFEFLNAVGIRTGYVSRVSEMSTDWETAFIARNCAMVPIEWVSRRVATGSYLRRNPHVTEGTRFAPPKLETFYKDDANHDPYWALETIIGAKLDCGGVTIGKVHVDEMLAVTRLVFEVLERAWSTVNISLIDMKIEFGIVLDGAAKGQIVVADVIDNDSWRLWPQGDKRLMLDKQVYRNLTSVDETAMAKIKANFEAVRQKAQDLFASLVPKPDSVSAAGPEVGILLGSTTDLDYANKIKKTLAEKYCITAVDVHVCSAHKSTNYALDVVAALEQWPNCCAIVACAGRSNGLGPVTAANCAIPVISSPPTSDLTAIQLDIWSSLRLPSGLGSGTVLGADNTAQAVAHIIAVKCPFAWAKLKTQQAYTAVKIMQDDAKLRN